MKEERKRRKESVIGNIIRGKKNGETVILI